MRKWQDIGSDVNWSEYGGKWAKRARDGSWYVVEFTNMWEACGEDDCKRDGQPQYVVEARRIDLSDLDDKTLKSALDCISCNLENVPEKHRELAKVEACASYGCYQPLDSFSGDHYPARVRADARRACEALMRDADALEMALDRPVNRIGSTAREFGRGDIYAALNRGPFDTGKNIMRKLSGLPEVPSGSERAPAAPAEHEITFGTLQPDGSLTDVRLLEHSSVQACRFKILVPEHYRSDGSCRCDDAEHRAMMIRDWEYSAADFEGIAVR